MLRRASRRECRRSVLRARQAGGHWFEPSTAHTKPWKSGIFVFCLDDACRSVLTAGSLALVNPLPSMWFGRGGANSSARAGGHRSGVKSAREDFLQNKACALPARAARPYSQTLPRVARCSRLSARDGGGLGAGGSFRQPRAGSAHDKLLPYSPTDMSVEVQVAHPDAVGIRGGGYGEAIDPLFTISGPPQSDATEGGASQVIARLSWLGRSRPFAGVCVRSAP